MEWVFLVRGIKSNVFRAYAIMGLAVLLLGAQLALAALSGNVTLGMVVGAIFTSVFLSFGLVVLAAMMGAF